MWNYIQPVEIIFGDNEIKNLISIIENKKYEDSVIVSTNHFVKNGMVQKLIDESNGKIKGYFSKIDANPTVENVNECSDYLKDMGAKTVITIGGGSAMDCAKAAATLCLTDDKIQKYHGTGVSMPKEHLPLIAIPTTSGTGSEVTCVSVLTDYTLNKKAPIVSDGFYPDLAIIDPTLTYSMPKHVTASTGIDVLSHALEGFWSKNHQPICDALALHACDLVFKYLYRAYENPMDKEARLKMSEASLIAGMAFSIPKTTSSHACSFPLTNLYNIPHGEACGLTLDYFARINAKVENARLDEFSKKLGFKDTEDMADAIVELKNKLNLLVDLKKFNLQEEDIDELVKLSEHPNLYNNPVKITKEILKDMYNKLICQ